MRRHPKPTMLGDFKSREYLVEGRKVIPLFDTLSFELPPSSAEK